MKEIGRIIAGLTASASLFYWTALPALAANSGGGGSGALGTGSILCPTSGGITPPGCGGKSFTIQEIISFAVNVLLFAAFVIALVFLIIGGIRWILSGGDKEATAKAKGTVTSALIGLAIVLAAWILINILLQVLTGQTLTNLSVPQL